MNQSGFKKKNILIEKLYDMASSKDENGLSSFDEAKLRKELKNGADKNFLRKNKEVFIEGEKRFFSCPRYNPCPICEKCKNKASHLYSSCAKCNIPICVHSYRDIMRLIKRKNFIVTIRDKTIIHEIKKMERECHVVQKEHLEKLH